MKLLLTKEDIHTEFQISYNLIDRLTQMGIFFRDPELNKYHRKQITQSLETRFNVQPEPDLDGVAGKLINDFKEE